MITYDRTKPRFALTQIGVDEFGATETRPGLEILHRGEFEFFMNTHCYYGEESWWNGKFFKTTEFHRVRD